MRKSCFDCCRKHLAQAEVLMMEAQKGYPVHAWLAVGHMAEAEDEMLTDYPYIASAIREFRVKYMAALNKNENFTHSLLLIIEEVTLQVSGKEDDNQNI